jgi:hypothetical protein
MITYKLQNKDGITVSILKSDGWSIPLDINNTDYQAYLKWISEGNTPEPADE